MSLVIAELPRRLVKITATSRGIRSLLPRPTRQNYSTQTARVPATTFKYRYSSHRTPSSSSFHPIAARSKSSLRIMSGPEPTIHPIFEPVTGTWQYIIADPITETAVIIDAVLDYDPATSSASTQSADTLLTLITKHNYTVSMILETHVHADHLTAASYLASYLAKRQASRPQIGIGSRIRQVQDLFGTRYGVPADEYANVFDKLWLDNESFMIGALHARAVHLPGHTPDHMGYHIGSNVFVGDSIFHMDIGSARADFPGGSAHDIFQSGRKLLSLPDDTKIWVGHDYPPAARKEGGPLPYATVREHREGNQHLRDGTLESEFVELREKRDATLGTPRLLHPSLQVNIRGGRLPEMDKNGQRLVHLPMKVAPELAAVL